jgi:hypothetical protein
LVTQEGFDPRFVPIDLLDDRSERVVVDESFDDEPTLTVELLGLRRGDAPERRVTGLPRERRVPRVRRRLTDGLPHESRA